MPVVLEILVTLASGAPYGYSFINEVRAPTGVTLWPGSLYRALNQLLTERLTVERSERREPRIHDERRWYYELTPPGLAVSRAEATRLRAEVGEGGWASHEELIAPHRERRA
jgi:DNA-binding PadR family transcriptional regulator